MAEGNFSQTAIMDQNLQMHKHLEAKAATNKTNSGGPKSGHNTHNNNKKKLIPFPMTRSKSCNIDESTPLFVSTTTAGRQSFSSMLSFSSSQQQLQACPTTTQSKNTIRFQVVVWYIGKIDMVQGRVPMTFRVTLFWNDRSDEVDDEFETESVSSKGSGAVWKMQGRQRAFQQEIMKETNANNATTLVREIPVPAVSILNVVSFDIVGSPEVSMLREDTKLMRWTCMYKATLVQEHWRVDSFPHDDHDIALKLAILTNRLGGQEWDRNVWELSLATEQDSQGSTRIPHGLVVDQMTIPEFMFDKDQGLLFDFVPLNHGQVGGGGLETKSDVCLEVKLTVLRDSGYYDNNIIPLVALLNLVAISTLFLEPIDFFQRALLTLNIAFVEIGIRMTTDSHLPKVGYQIKLQKILNEYFCGLLLLVLEGNLVYELHRAGSKHTIYVDACAAILALAHNIYTISYYYMDAHNAAAKLRGKSRDG